ncbi:hypothetical protein RJ639_029558, partial [Escallonia herrerae]
MSEFQTLRESIHQEHRQLVERRVFTGTRVAEETIERMIETGDSEQIFQKAIREQGRGQIMDTLAEIQERHDAVREVERKLLELQQFSRSIHEGTNRRATAKGEGKEEGSDSQRREGEKPNYILMIGGPRSGKGISPVARNKF